MLVAYWAALTLMKKKIAEKTTDTTETIVNVDTIPFQFKY